ncbi:MAG: phosphoribosylglycinamide formyltransferase [Gammaproteobacteria bacterium]|jgi:phosphoribosylglycinamide formyltransferase-1
MTLKRLGFLASHRGTNMQSIFNACRRGRLSAVPVVVISNNGDSGALERAENEGIPAYHISSRTFTDPDNLDRAICETLVRHEVDLVILAGYMKRLGPRTLSRFRGRVINIHPSLLPKYGGRGMYGDKVHEAVLAAGEEETGVTVHLVTGDYDAGPILLQKRVPVRAGDTVRSLADRVLAVEHETYVEALAGILSGEIALPTSQ